jgi:chaperonin GroES
VLIYKKSVVQLNKEVKFMKLRPLGDRVMVKALEQKEVKKSGIIIPETAKEKPQEGEIIAVGKGKVADDGKLIAMDVKVGDKILFGKYSGTEVKIEDVEYLIMHQDDILGVIEK